ncbi:hypothetical protein VT84_09325 [Gemmata sp. SH-PL17]|uniref:hypothetical protein n=1 Tax=Gemmata sp. SH-PL17 TaxID=1630693 RepID=UPI00078CF06E|nr:hypothetical protein [Gemmata sp. SH-PL17]AMV24584.1 hypothetical protein VT84_09325 [Gemmata sp. SH-PL17]
MANLNLPATGSPVNVEAVTSLNGQTVPLGNFQRTIQSIYAGPGVAYDIIGGAGNVTPGTQRITLATDDAAIATLATILGIVDSAPAANTVNDRLRLVVAGLAAILKVGGKYSASLPTLTDGETAQLPTDVNSVLYTNPGALSAALDSVTAKLATATSGGTQGVQYTMAASTNATVVKASAGQRYKVIAINTNAAEPRYVHFCDSASAPTPGTTTVKTTLAVPAASSSILPTVVGDSQANGLEFAAGISFYVTKGFLPSNTTALTDANDMLVIVEYK